MTWVGIGGLIGSELMSAVVAQPPNYLRIERLTVRLVLDCVYRGYNLDYLTTLFDRYMREGGNLRDSLLRIFRRIHSPQRHQYQVYFILKGATAVTARPGEPNIQCCTSAEFCEVVEPSDERARFLEQLTPGPAVVVSLEWSQDPDAGSAAEACRQEIQEIVDYLDFQSPTQRFELAPLALVCFVDALRAPHQHLYPDTSGGQPRRLGHEVEIEPEWVNQLKGLSEALRWSAVARRERTPEVALLAAWFAFEFLAGDIDKSPVEGIMEFFPKTLGIGNIRRRLHYWWRCLQASPGFAQHPRREAIADRATHHGGSPDSGGIFQILTEVAAAVAPGAPGVAPPAAIPAVAGPGPTTAPATTPAGTAPPAVAPVAAAPPTEDARAVLDIARSSVLLRERTASEARLFTNSQLVAETLQREAQQIRWDLQRVFMIRNKLVHRARIAHPLLVIVSGRAKRLLYDLLRDLSAQLTTRRLRNSVAEVLRDLAGKKCTEL
jgi:hypothetical protein